MTTTLILLIAITATLSLDRLLQPAPEAYNHLLGLDD